MACKKQSTGDFISVVRIANTKDVFAVSRLYDEFYKFNHSLQQSFYAEVKESGQYPQSVIDSETGDIFIADIDTVPVGFIHVEEEKTPPFHSVSPHRFACVVDLYVTPDYQKRGLGKALLEKAKDWSSNRGLEYLELLVLEENEIRMSFYKRESFKVASQIMRFIL